MRYLQHGGLPDALTAYRGRFHYRLSHALSVSLRGLRHISHPTTVHMQPGATHNMHALDIPPTQNLSARVEHILVDEPGTLSQVIAKALVLPQVECCGNLRATCANWSMGGISGQWLTAAGLCP